MSRLLFCTAKSINTDKNAELQAAMRKKTNRTSEASHAPEVLFFRYHLLIELVPSE